MSAGSGDAGAGSLGGRSQSLFDLFAEGSSGDRAEAKSGVTRLQAMGGSLLLPGLGQILSGHSDRGRIYLMAEASMIMGFVLSEVQGHNRKNDYIEYAEQFAGISDAGGQPDWFYRNLGSYGSYEDYRDDIARTARAIYGDDLAARAAYIEENLRGVPRWEWPSREQRLEYRDRRESSRSAFRRASFFVGGALLNRLVSVVDAAWLAGRDRRAKEGADGRASGGEKAPDRALYFQPLEEGGYVCLQWTFSN